VVLEERAVLAGLGDDMIRFTGKFLSKSLECLAEDDLGRMVMRS
jgi:hypothetical protein